MVNKVDKLALKALVLAVVGMALLAYSTLVATVYVCALLGAALAFATRWALRADRREQLRKGSPPTEDEWEDLVRRLQSGPDTD